MLVRVRPESLGFQCGSHPSSKRLRTLPFQGKDTGSIPVGCIGWRSLMVEYLTENQRKVGSIPPAGIGGLV